MQGPLVAAGISLVMLTSSAGAQEVEVGERFKVPLKSGSFEPEPLERAASRPGTPSPAEEPPVAHPTSLQRVILQFERLPSRSQIEALRERGTTLHEYLGGNSYYATIRAAPGAVAAQDETIRAISPVTVEQKLDPRLASARDTAAESDETSEAARQEVRVQIWQDANFDRVISQILGLDAIVTEEQRSFSSATVLLRPNSLDKMANLSGVKFIEPAPPPKQRFNDGQRLNMGVEPLYVTPYEIDGSGTRIGIWDGGSVAATHDDFEGRLTVVDDFAATDEHATHVAGTVGGSGLRSDADEERLVARLLLAEQSEQLAEAGDAAEAADAAEIEAGAGPYEDEEVVRPVPLGEASSAEEKRWHGVAPGTQIFSYDWDEPDTDHESAIRDHDIQVSQNSWGFVVEGAPTNNCDEYGDYTGTARSYDQIVTGNLGKRIAVVFAAGNERNDGDCGLSGQPPFVNYGVITPPVTAKNIITVGAINSDDGTMTDFSSWGPTDRGSMKPDVVAPGCERGGDGGITSTVPPNDYGVMCGTSMAAPAVSGTLALLLEEYAELGLTDPLPSSQKALLIHGAQDLDDPGPDYRTGYGAVVATATVDLVRENKITESSIDTTGQIQTAAVDVPSGTRELKVTLAWDDPPGALASVAPLVNDLDLELRSPSDVLHLPWVLDPGQPERAAQEGVDRVNVVEQVLVRDPEPGSWQIQIRGHAVAMPPQPLSLIVTTAE